MSNLITHLVIIFRQCLPQSLTDLRWCQTSLQFVMRCPSRHYAGRSLQVLDLCIRCVCWMSVDRCVLDECQQVCAGWMSTGVCWMCVDRCVLDECRQVCAGWMSTGVCWMSVDRCVLDECQQVYAGWVSTGVCWMNVDRCVLDECRQVLVIWHLLE